MSDKDTRFKPGESGNPTGRPKGSRNKLSEAFIEALFADFAEHGPATIVAAREADPVAYVKVVASLLPREMKVGSDLREMTDEELEKSLRRGFADLKAQGFDFGDAEPDQPKDGITH